MADLLFKTDFISKRTDLPKVQNVEDIIYVETFEDDAWDHWIFGKNASSLTGRVNGHVLAVQTGATILPVYNDNNVVLDAKNGNAIIADFVDGATQNTTLTAVVKTNSTGLAILMGTLVPGSYTGSSGHGIFAGGEKGYVTVKPLTASNAGGADSKTPLNDIDQIEYFFISASVNKTTKTVIIYTERLGVGASLQFVWSSAYQASLNKIAVGNGYYSGAIATSLTFAEAIIHDKALSLSRLQDMASKSKLRMKNRGIAF
jgi:hypothetical protein